MTKPNKREICRKLFIEWFNNYLTMEVFAEHYDMRITQAERAIKLGRILHNRRAEQ